MENKSIIREPRNNFIMEIGKASGIFRNINSPKYSNEEKILAIRIVIDMETHNSFTKDNLLEVLGWLWNNNYELKRL